MITVTSPDSRQFDAVVGRDIALVEQVFDLQERFARFRERVCDRSIDYSVGVNREGVVVVAPRLGEPSQTGRCPATERINIAQPRAHLPSRNARYLIADAPRIDVALDNPRIRVGYPNVPAGSPSEIRKSGRRLSYRAVTAPLVAIDGIDQSHICRSGVQARDGERKVRRDALDPDEMFDEPNRLR